MRYQGSEAFDMDYAVALGAERESRQAASLEVLTGGGLDARARRGVSREFVGQLRNILIIACALIAIGLVRVYVSAATVTTLSANSSLRSAVTDAKNLNNDLKIERAVLASNSRIARIATQNYGMTLSTDALTVKVGDAAEAEAAEQAAAEAAEQAAEQQAVAEAEAALAAASEPDAESVAEAASEAAGLPSDVSSALAGDVDAAQAAPEVSYEASLS